MEEIERARKHINYFEKCFDIIADEEDIYGNAFELATDEQMDNFEKIYDIMGLKKSRRKKIKKIRNGKVENGGVKWKI